MFNENLEHNLPTAWSASGREVQAVAINHLISSKGWWSLRISHVHEHLQLELSTAKHQYTCLYKTYPCIHIIEENVCGLKGPSFGSVCWRIAKLYHVITWLTGYISLPPLHKHSQFRQMWTETIMSTIQEPPQSNAGHCTECTPFCQSMHIHCMDGIIHTNKGRSQQRNILDRASVVIHSKMQTIRMCLRDQDYRRI